MIKHSVMQAVMKLQPHVVGNHWSEFCSLDVSRLDEPGRASLNFKFCPYFKSLREVHGSGNTDSKIIARGRGRSLDAPYL